MRKTIRRSVLLVMGFSGSAVLGSQMAYSITGIGTGVFAGQNFNNASYLISMTADTSTISNVGGGIYVVVPNSTEIAVSGIGATGSFTNNVLVVSNQNNSNAGFGDVDQDFAIEFVHNPAFSGYNLATPIGPLSGGALYNLGVTFPTTAGDFEFDSLANATFTAQPVPEPSSLVAVSLGLFVCRRKVWK